MGKTDTIHFKPAKKHGWKRKLGFAAITLTASLFILISGFAYIYKITPPDTTLPFRDTINLFIKPGEAAFQGNRTLNILCLGIDHNYDEKGMPFSSGARSDTVFVISVDSNGEQVNMLSIPRDTWVNIPGYGFEKINAAYALGDISLAKKVIGNFLGVEMDHYVVIRVKAAEELVNALGGLEIDVEKDMDYDDNWGNLHVHLRKGPQVLSGKDAVGYARFRYDEEGDWGRMRRQQQVINTVIKEVKKPANLTKLDKIGKIIHENVDTDLTAAQIVDLARLYKDFDRSRMKSGIIKGDDAFSSAGASIIIPYEDEKMDLVKKLLVRDGTVIPSQIKIGVLNGSKTEGLAGQLADILESRGYTVTRVADADRYDYEKTIVVEYGNNPELHRTFSEILGFTDLRHGTTDENSYNEDFTVVIGNNWLAWREEHPVQIESRRKPDIRTDYGNTVRYTNPYEDGSATQKHHDNAPPEPIQPVPDDGEAAADPAEQPAPSGDSPPPEEPQSWQGYDSSQPSSEEQFRPKPIEVKPIPVETIAPTIEVEPIPAEPEPAPVSSGEFSGDWPEE